MSRGRNGRSGTRRWIRREKLDAPHRGVEAVELPAELLRIKGFFSFSIDPLEDFHHDKQLEAAQQIGEQIMTAANDKLQQQG
jgi:hypothetical protein